MTSAYLQKIMAWELSRKRNSASEDKFTGVLSEARVDLNPHQVDAALFAFRSPLSKGAIMEDSFARRLLTLPIKKIENEYLVPASVDATLEKAQDALTEELEVRNSDLVSDEIVKIENWAEDSRKSLQQKLNELDKAIDKKMTSLLRSEISEKNLPFRKRRTLSTRDAKTHGANMMKTAPS